MKIFTERQAAILKNAWRDICSEEKLNVFFLLGCDKKYFDGAASDFECFCKWIEILPLIKGHVEEEAFFDRMRNILSDEYVTVAVARQDAVRLWSEYNRVSGYYFDDGIDLEFCDEKYYKDLVDTSNFEYVEKDNEIASATLLDFESVMDASASSTDFCDLVNFFENKENRGYFLNIYDCEFSRPNPYVAEIVFKKIKNGEFCNNSEKNILLCQIILELIYRRKIQIILPYDLAPRTCVEIVDYMLLRGICARIFLRIDKKCDVDAVKALCLKGVNGLRITPILVTEKDSDFSEFSARLFRVIPRGAISFT